MRRLSFYLPGGVGVGPSLIPSARSGRECLTTATQWLLLPLLGGNLAKTER